MKTRIEKIEERLVYSDNKNPWIKLYFDQVRFPNGQLGYYNRIVESEGKSGVAVLPIKGELIGLLRQFRYPIGKEVWEIPRGFGECENPQEDALRELKEETGIEIEPERLIYLSVIHPNSGILASSVHLFAALCDQAQQTASQEDTEATEFRWVPLEKVLSLIEIGEITDPFTMSTILLIKQRLKM